MVRLTPVLIASLLVAAAWSAATTAQTSGPEPTAPPPSGNQTSPPPPGPSGDPHYQDCMARATTEDQKRSCANDYCLSHRDSFCESMCKAHPEQSACPHPASTSTPPPSPSPPPSGPGSDPQTRECYQNAPDDAHRQQCLEAYCKAHQDDFCARWCQEHPNAGACLARHDGEQPTGTGHDQPDPANCQETCFEPSRHHWITFETQSDAPGIANYRVQDLLTILKVQLNEQPLKVHRDGRVIEARGENYVLRLHDEPGGLMRYEGTTQIIIGFPTDATITHDDKEAVIHYASGERGVLRYENATWFDASSKVTLTGFFAFHVPPREVPHVAKQELRNGLKDAMENGHLGAQIALNHSRVRSTDSVQVLAYDDVDVAVTGPQDQATEANPVAIELSANLTEGRTIALTVDPRLLPSPDAKRLVLHYYDLHDGVRTEVVFRQASSLKDILDPTDDAGQPEYWIVQDANGIQVMITVPHWSSHIVTLAGLAAVLQPNVLAGIAAGVVGSVLAGAALFWPRRRDA